jgi:hypothetical protein
MHSKCWFLEDADKGYLRSADNLKMEAVALFKVLGP